jgi:hypothetical protein
MMDIDSASASASLDINDMDQMALTSIRATVNEIGIKPLRERLYDGIDEDMYVTIARTELACLKLLLRVNSLRMQIDKLDEDTSYFHFTLLRDDGTASGQFELLGDTTCVIMGNEATQMLQIRRSTPEFQNLEKENTEFPVVKMEFTRLHVNGFKGAEIIQRYIMCLCAIGGVHIMIKDIMTDLAGFQKDWNNNIGCFPIQDFSLSRTKYFNASQEASQGTQSTSQDSSYTSDSNDSYSQGPDTTSSQEEEDLYNTCDVSVIPDIGREQAKELVYYFVFQHEDEIQQVLKEIKLLNPEKNPNKYSELHAQLQRAITKTHERLTSIKDNYFEDMYSNYLTRDETHNQEVENKKAAAKVAFQVELERILPGIEYTYLNRDGAMPDYDFSPEAMLIINKLFETDLSGDYFKKNLIDIAARIQRKLPTGLNIDEFGASLDRILRRELLPATATAQAISSPSSPNKKLKTTTTTRGATGAPSTSQLSGQSAQLLTSTMTGTQGNSFKRKVNRWVNSDGGARNPTKKAQHKNKRTSKRKKNKKRAIKTQKKKRNKTRK